MPKDQNTGGYRMRVLIELVEVNKYGDVLNEDTLHFTKTINVKSITDLGVVLARLDEIGE